MSSPSKKQMEINTFFILKRWLKVWALADFCDTLAGIISTGLC